MAKSKANKAKKGKSKAASQPKKTVDAVEAKLTDKEIAAVEAEVVDKDLDEEVEDVEETETEEVTEEAATVEADEASEDEAESDDEDAEEDESDEEDEKSDDDSDDEDDSEEDEADAEEDDEDDERLIAVEKAKEKAAKAKKEAKKAAKAAKKAKKAAKAAEAAIASELGEDTEAEDDKKEKAADVKVKTIVSEKKPSFIKSLFARKHDASENILTIFKDSKIVGALIGEFIGSILVTMLVLTLGLFNPLYMIFAYTAIVLFCHKLSGANLNPIITAGMLASRRMSAIRGVLYIIVQVLGAWVGYVIINGFLQAGIATGNVDSSTATLAALTHINDIPVVKEGASYFWPLAMVEFLGAIILAFGYARALKEKQNTLSFAVILSSSVFLALTFATLISSGLLGLNANTYILNPAVAAVYGLLPSAASGFDALMQALAPMFVCYVVFPILGGIIGFFISDLAGQLRGEKLDEE